MFKAFELKLDEADNLQELIDLTIEEFAEISENGYEKGEIGLKYMLPEFIQDGVINGTEISDEIFPVLRKDVFLSHSHNDKALAYIVAEVLKKWFGLSVFIDSMFWGSADELLRTVDNKYCRKNEGTYSYRRRNLTTSHVHAMLSTAIMKVMDQAEIIIFLNTSNSVPRIEGTMEEEYTLSPWIYEEILLSSMLRKINRRTGQEDYNVAESIMEHFEKDVNFAYTLPKKLIPLSLQDIKKWKEKYTEIRGENILFMGQGKERHPLDILYKIK